METKGHDRKFTVCAIEAIGTSLLLFGIISTNMAVSIPFVVFAPIVYWGDLTGGHFNPAVTLGVFITLGEYSKNWVFMILIIASEIFGGMIGILLAYLGEFKKAGVVVPIMAPFNPYTKTFDGQNTDEFTMDYNVVVNEVICTFIFVSVVLMVKGKHTAGGTRGIRAAVGVCFTLMSIIASTSRLGASFNPAVGISLTLNSFWLLKETEPYMYHYSYAYILGPFFGGFLAALFHMFHAKQHEPLVNQDSLLPADRTLLVRQADVDRVRNLNELLVEKANKSMQENSLLKAENQLLRSERQQEISKSTEANLKNIRIDQGSVLRSQTNQSIDVSRHTVDEAQKEQLNRFYE